MSYYFAKTLPGSMTDVEERTTAALKEKGFGVLTEIDIQATMKKKLDKDMAGYKILGACNPPLAFQALTAEPHIGLMLPCNVILRDVGNGQVEVAAVDPVASMAAVQNDDLGGVATDVRDRLRQVIEGL
ncbi:MAG: DUF302 domain-containing protein [Rhodothermales bacterium]